MRKLLLLAVIVLAAAALSSSAAAVSAPVGVSYQTYEPGGPVGDLFFTNAEGRTFQAFDIHGALMLEGVVGAPMWATVCPNSGADQDGTMLWVNLEPDLWFALNGDDGGDIDPEDFWWDF